MTREEFSYLVKGMKAVYSSDRFIQDKDAFDVWYGLVGHLDYQIASMAVKKHIMTSPYPPTVKDILDNTRGPEESEGGAWDEVRRAIHNGIYGAEAEFDKLSDLAKAAVGSPASLREWATMPSDQVETVIQSHFVRRFRTLQERARVDEITGPLLDVKELGKIGGEHEQGHIIRETDERPGNEIHTR